MEQFDDILRTFINEMNKFESIDAEKMLAVKKLMPESLLNYRFTETTVSYSEITIALENIIVDKVSTVPSSKNRRNDTSAPMEIGMAAKEDGESASQEGDQRIMENGDSAKVKIGMRRETGHIAAWCRKKGGNRKLYAVDEDDGENAEESTENEEDLQAWCLLEESENEQWQEVISKPPNGIKDPSNFTPDVSHMLSCHRSSCRAHCASIFYVPSQSLTTDR